MSLKEKLIKGGVSLSAGSAATNILSFIRNVIIARLVSPADFGLASLFALTINFLQMLSNLSAETLLIQSEHGNKNRFLGAVHSFQVIRSIFLTMILFWSAGLVARLFSVPEATWAFRTLAMVPLLRGFINRDINRVQRNYRFGPRISTEVGSALIATLAAIPICLVLKDYSAMLWVLIIQSSTMVLLSHIFSERPFLLKSDSLYNREILRFGWPLLINGLLMFFIFQGDRFIIGASQKLFNHGIYTLEMLAYYSAAFAMTLAPTLMITMVMNTLLLPLLSQVQNDRPIYIARYRNAVQFVCLIACFFAIPFILGGEFIMVAVFGNRYAVAGTFIGILGAMQAVRLMRVVPTIAAMSFGDTKNALISNIFRSTGLLGALFFAARGMDLEWIALSGLIGEIIAVFVCIVRLQAVHRIPSSLAFGPALVTVLLVATSALFGRLFGHAGNLINFFGLVLVGCVLSLILTFSLFPDLRLQALTLFRREA